MAAASKSIRILLVDDDEDDFVLFRTVLQKIPKHPYVLEWISSYDDAYSIIATQKHDIYIVDYMLGVKSGLELLRDFDVLQRREPFIILTGAANGSIEKEALKAGAADYLVKGSFDQELLARVLNYSLQRKSVEAQRINELMDINRSKDEFIAVASHELRTPATAVKQYIAMIMDGYSGEITEQQRAFLKRAYDSNERQLQIIDDILRVAQLDLEKIRLDVTQVDLIALIDRIINDYEPVATKRQQKIILKAPNDEVLISADETYMRMAIANIIDNASKYSEEHKTMIVRVSSSDSEVVISVIDEGVGIAQKDLPKLFVKFSRIHNPLSIQRGGTGLGLYWSREIIRLHGGNISVTSTPAKGTTFDVSLALTGSDVR